jgi:hypothetical protein
VLRVTVVAGASHLGEVEGAVICRDLTLADHDETTTIRRGAVVDAALRAIIERHPGTRLHVVVPEPGEVTQPDASQQLAAALAGAGVAADPPHQGQVVVKAAVDGLLRVRGASVTRVNELGSFLVATGLDGRVIAAGDTIAVVKASRLWVSGQDISRAIRMLEARPVLRVAPFVARRGAFVVPQRLRAANVRAASKSLSRTFAGYGAELVETVRVTDDPVAIALALEEIRSRGTELVLVAGSIVLDPGDPFLVALESLGAQIVVRGAPIDPGTMFWVANLQSMELFGLASCEMYGRLSVLDLVLPYAIAHEPIDVGLLAELGYGGLLHQTFASRRRSSSGQTELVEDGS